MSALRADRPTPGLRERKKAKTRATLQRQALALFREQGYAATTIEQIAAAAEVSESTFFRYFPTKEDIVFSGGLDLVFPKRFRAQPETLGVVPALHFAMRSMVETMTPQELADLRDLSVMIFSVPELWGSALVQLTDGMGLVAGLVAERLARDPCEVAIRTFAGALVGVMISLLRDWVGNPDLDILASIEEAMAFVTAGLPLAQGAR